MIKMKNIQTLATISATSILFALGVSNAHATSNIGEVTANSLNMRSGPSTAYSVIGGLKKGDKVTIILSQDNWYNVSFQGKKGWVSGTYVSIKSQSTENPPANSPISNKKLMATAGVNVRSGNSTSYKKIGYIKKNEIVEMLGVSNNGWYKVRLNDQTVGYASNLYLKEVTTSNDNTNNDNTTTEEVLIATANLNLRVGPSTSYSAVGLIYKNEKVTLIERTSNGWCKVKLSNGKIGYCSGAYLKSQSQIDSATNKPSSVEDVAYTMDVKAYAYCTGNITATGTKPTFGRTIAVDPTVIPYGTRVYIKEFDKTFIAEDCGGAIKGNKIDIYMNTKEECINWGVRNLTIYILK